jgi:glycosyltransferase involved in cell wall biosynthesis
MSLARLRVAIVHERFTEWAGSERVVEQLHAMWPEAPIHAAVVDRAVLPESMRDADIRPTPLQRLYRGGRGYAHLLPLLPLAFRRIDLRGVDLVVVSHHAFANRVRPPSGVPVLSYVHTPSRWIWDPAELTGEVGGAAGRAALALYARVLRAGDRAAARRMSEVVANSDYVAEKVHEYWGRNATVVPPPVDIDWFTPDPEVEREDFFLFVGRLVPYKRPELAVTAARRAGVKLVMVGDGRLRGRLESIAPPNVQLLGAGDPLMLLDLYRRCRALVFPGVELFGIVPVEAQACSAPVIARGAGGALESVVHGTTGVLYQSMPDRETDTLATVLEDFDDRAYDSRRIRRNAERFSAQRFRTDLLEKIDWLLETPRLT